MVLSLIVCISVLLILIFPIWNQSVVPCHIVISYSLWPHGLQHTRPLCPWPSPKVCPNSCPLNQWCHSAISSSDMLFSLFPQSFSASGIFLRSQPFTSDDQNTGVSASASVVPTSIQGWFPLRFISLISLLFKGLSGVFPSITVQRYQFFDALPSQSSSHSQL